MINCDALSISAAGVGRLGRAAALAAAGLLVGARVLLGRRVPVGGAGAVDVAVARLDSTLALAGSAALFRCVAVLQNRNVCASECAP